MSGAVNWNNSALLSSCLREMARVIFEKEAFILEKKALAQFLQSQQSFWLSCLPDAVKNITLKQSQTFSTITGCLRNEKLLTASVTKRTGRNT